MSNQAHAVFASRNWVLVVGWIVTIVGGAVVLGQYASIPGMAETAPSQWPADAKTMPKAGQPTLVLFVHPRCPCSRATLGELARLLSRRDGSFDTHVLFYKPNESAPDWEKTDLWSTAQAIPGVQVASDRDGAEAARFGVKTSGQVLLYDHLGQLVYTGGITTARGHAGDSPGRNAILTWLRTGELTRASDAAFGCSLVNDSFAFRRQE